MRGALNKEFLMLKIYTPLMCPSCARHDACVLDHALYFRSRRFSKGQRRDVNIYTSCPYYINYRRDPPSDDSAPRRQSTTDRRLTNHGAGRRRRTTTVGHRRRRMLLTFRVHKGFPLGQMGQGAHRGQKGPRGLKAHS